MPQNNFLKSQLPQKQLSTLPANKYLLVFESQTIEDSVDTSFSRKKKFKSFKAFGLLNILKLGKDIKYQGSGNSVFLSSERDSPGSLLRLLFVLLGVIWKIGLLLGGLVSFGKQCRAHFPLLLKSARA